MKDKLNKMSNKHRLKEIMLMYISAFYEKGVMFLLTFLLARTLSLDGFGEYSYYMAFGGIVFSFFDLGGDFFQTKKITQSKVEYFTYNIIFAKLLVFLAILFIGSLYIISKGEKVTEFILVIILFFMDSISSVFKSISYVFNKYSKESLILLMEKSTMILFIVVILKFSRSVETVFLGIILSKGIFVFIRYCYFAKMGLIRNKIQILRSLKLIKEAVIFVVHALLSTIFFQVDILMIKHIRGYAEVGIYNAAVKVVLASMIIPEILFKFFYPQISKYIKVELARSIYSFKKFLYIQLSIIFPIVIGMFFGSQWIINLLYGSEYPESVMILKILLLQVIFRYCMYPFTALLSAGDKQGLKTITSAVCVMVNCGINYFLIPIYGIYGAAIATVITEFTLLLLYVFFCGEFFVVNKSEKIVV